MTKKTKEDFCKVCGKQEIKLREGLCKRHWLQFQEFGFTIDDAQKIDTNEIIIHNEYSELIIYNELTEGIKTSITLDTEDIDKIKDITWRKEIQTVLGEGINGKNLTIQNVIMNCDDKVMFIDGDYTNCRKSNLKKSVVKKKSSKIIVSNKNKNKVIIEFVGKSQEQVTGSAILVSVPIGNGEYKKILVEFGSSQTNRDLATELIYNKEIVESVPCSELDYVFTLHIHQDHCGLLPSLINNGFKGRLCSNYENSKLMLPMLLDSAFIMNKNVNSINKNKKKNKVEALYTEEDVYLLMNKIDEYSMNEIHELTPEISFQFINAGHILGSCQLFLYLKNQNGQIKKIHITSDLGSSYNKQPFVRERDVVTSSSVSIVEATYNNPEVGFSSKKEVTIERDEFRDFIKDELKNRRSILIGAFAQARQQTLMEYMYRTFKDDKKFNYTIYIDGVLGSKINNVYQEVLTGDEKEYFREILAWDKFHYINSYERSQEVALNKEEIKLCISSSGMFNGGRILNHLKTSIEDRNSTVVQCGYQSEGTIGRELQRDDNTKVRIETLDYKKKCKVHKLNTWSSHIQCMESIKFMSNINTPMIILHHSDKSNKYEFRDLVESELRKRNNTAKIVCASDENNIFYI